MVARVLCALGLLLFADVVRYCWARAQFDATPPVPYKYFWPSRNMLSVAGFGAVDSTGDGGADRVREAKGLEDSDFAESRVAGTVLSTEDVDAVSLGFSATGLSAVCKVLSSGNVFPGFCAPEEVAAEPFVASSFVAGMSPTPVFGFAGRCCAVTGGATSDGMTPVFSPEELELSAGFVEAD